MSKSVYQLFAKTVAERHDKVGAQYKVDGSWRDVTWGEIADNAARIAAGLMELGVGPGDRVAILSNTRIEWSLADLGIMSAGAVTVPIYQSNIGPDVEYILADSGSLVVFAEDKEQLEKLRTHRTGTPALRKVVCFTDDGLDAGDDREMGLEALMELGAARLAREPDAVRDRGEALTYDDLLTLIYTSGTTGKPKGTMLTHEALVEEVNAIVNTGVISSGDIQYLFLPLAHVMAKALEVGWWAAGFVMAFWEGDQAKIVDNLGEVRPTLMVSVPRVYEKVFARVVGDIESGAGPAGMLGRWALRGYRAAMHRELQGLPAGGVGWWFARQLVFTKIAAKLSDRFGGRLRFFVSGGAPLPAEIAFFFKYAGVDILEGYGLTETSAAACINLLDAKRLGTVGKPLPGVDVKIADDGEILIRGPIVMKGYWNREDATREVLDPDGWFHSGDIGEFDKDGFLRITDRKKDIIVTAGGKNIAPQNLEGTLKSKSPLISQVVVHGDKRKYLSALVTIDRDALRDWAAKVGFSTEPFDYAKVTQTPELEREVRRIVDDFNRGLASYETLKKFRILDHDFEIGEQLTPTLKVKRKVCNERYADVFESMYA